jgi:hypothetical protein
MTARAVSGLGEIWAGGARRRAAWRPTEVATDALVLPVVSRSKGAAVRGDLP